MIITILVCGIPAIGKSYFCERILGEHIKQSSSPHRLIYLCFDKEESIDKDNYTNFQSMRDNFLVKFQNELNDAAVLNQENEKCYIVLDDNFYLKSMRKKFYQAVVERVKGSPDKRFAYSEIIFQSQNIKYCLDSNQKRPLPLPGGLIEKMFNEFEFDSPYLGKSRFSFIINIFDSKSFSNLNIKNILSEIEKNVLDLPEKENFPTLKKDATAEFIDELELRLRKEVSALMKSEKNLKGKFVSARKKDFMRDANMIMHGNECSNELGSILKKRNEENQEEILNELVKYFVINIKNSK